MQNYIVNVLKKLVHIPSPSGYTNEIMEFVQKEAEGFGYQCETTQKGGLLILVPGKEDGTIGLAAHADTLGAMVRSITSEGKLKFTQVGGMTMESIEGTYCKIHTRNGQVYEGTILSKSPSVHAYEDARTLQRLEKNMEIRLDEIVKSKEDVQELGIEHGDYISFEPDFQYTEKGFIKSRHLDDKASVAILLGLLREMSEKSLVPKQNVKILISNYEEVGFGASWLPEDIREFIVVDMGVMGEDLNGDEYSVSICAKDSSGPYDYHMTSALIDIAKEKQIKYAVDIFPFYGSDGSSALRGGNNIKCALIGPGVHASHGMERTHITALEAVHNLLTGYLIG